MPAIIAATTTATNEHDDNGSGDDEGDGMEDIIGTAAATRTMTTRSEGDGHNFDSDGSDDR